VGGLVVATVIAAGTIVAVNDGGTQASRAGKQAGQASLPLPPPVYSAEQMNAARTIIGVGKAMNVPREGWVLGVAAGLAESDLRNLANPYVPASLKQPHDGLGADGGAVGAFQLSGGGTVVQRMSESYSAASFYRSLLAIPGWREANSGVAIQTALRSAISTGFDRWIAMAQSLVAANANAPAVKPADSGQHAIG
jgi:hypothetical protein